MLTFQNDTITALATPIGIGALSIIRISGPDSILITDKVFTGKKKLVDCKSHTIHYGKIVGSANEIIDDVLVSIFLAPNSYTGENSIEISCHGSQFVVSIIISILLNNGARIAEPGEFTKRAFLNGRIDLSQAEAVADIINSRTAVSLKGARNQFDGILSNSINELRNQLIQMNSLVELELDFAEEELEFVAYDEIIAKLNKTISFIQILIDSYSYGKVVRDGINIALVGNTNVGKSSLLNCFLKNSRAIVSEIPGTTRDVISEEISIKGFLFKFHDTAGIRTSIDEIENIGVERSYKTISEADLVLFIGDLSSPFEQLLFDNISKLIDSDSVVKVGNKVDINNSNLNNYDINISAKTGVGIDLLIDLLVSRIKDANIYSEKTNLVTNIRHKQLLENTKQFLLNGIVSCNAKLSNEFIAIDIRSGIDSLGEIIGQVSSEDILNNIFSNFCIGK